MSTDVITRLIVNADGATVGTDKFVAQMRRAEQAANNLKTENEKSVASVTKAWENQNARLDPVYKAQLTAQRELVKAQELSAKAVKLGITDQKGADTSLLSLAKRHADLIKNARDGTTVQGQHSSAMRVAAAAAAELNGKLQGSASALGATGNVMAAMGPVGLAVAATLGAIAVGFVAASSASLRLGDDLGKLVDQAETTGISFKGLQGLQKLAADSGIGPEKLNSGLDRLTLGLVDVKDAEGQLYKEIVKANPALAQQMLITKSNEEQINLLAKAYRAAGDDVKIVEAAFGKRNIGMGRLLGGIADAGGIDGLVKAIDPRDIVPDEVGIRLDKLTDQIKYMFRTARDNVVLSFADPVLDVLKDMTDQFLIFSREVRNWKSPEDLRAFLKDWIKEAVADIRSLLGLIGEIAGGIGEAIRFIRQQRDQYSGHADALTGNVNPNSVDMFGGHVPGTNTAVKAAGPSYVGAHFPDSTSGENLGAEIRLLEGRIRGLANQIVGTESFAHLATQADQLKKALADKRREFYMPTVNSMGWQVEGPPAASKRTPEADATEAARRNTVLGPAVTDAEAYAASVLKLNVLIKHNSDFTAEGARAQKALADGYILASTQAKIGLGIATEQEVVEAALLRTRQALAKAGIDDAEKVGLANQIALKAAKEQNEQLQIRASMTPALTRFSLDAKNLDKSLDQLAVSGLSKFEDALISIADGTKTASQAFADMTKAILADILKLVIRMNITGPLAGMLSGGGLGSMIGLPPIFANGAAFNSGNVVPFANGTVVTGPTAFPMAGGKTGLMGEAGWEAIMPLMRGPSGKLGVTMHGPAANDNSRAGTVVTFRPVINNYASKDTEVETKQSDDGKSFEVFIRKFKKEMKGELAEDIARGRGPVGHAVNGKKNGRF